jgi:hypothetical protein
VVVVVVVKVVAYCILQEVVQITKTANTNTLFIV